jgi:hypoxanthine phosphoribosyltransferase
MKKLFKKRQINRKVKQIAKEISNRHKGDQTSIVFVGILNGAFMFFSDLIKEIDHPYIECDFLRAKSYYGTTQGELEILKYIETSLTGKHVYVIDDIYDTGITMSKVITLLNRERPKTITPVTLLKRQANNAYDGNLIFGFQIQDEWVEGYGMDGKLGYGRNLPFILDV